MTRLSASGFRRPARATLVAALVILNALRPTPHALAQAPTVVDDFSSVAAWRPMAADGVTLRLAGDLGRRGRGLRMDFAFAGGGYAVARRAVRLELPENYEISFWMRGAARPQTLEFKLVDSTGDNVWWVNRPGTRFGPEWRRVVIKKRQVSFAWGPKGGGEITHPAAIEIAVTAGEGGRGTVWIDDLVVTPLAPVTDAPIAPIATASSGDAAHAVDGDSASAWRPAPGDRARALTLDLGGRREFGGLTVDWADAASDYDVDLSPDGVTWTPGHRFRGSRARAGRDHLYLPESDARFVRLRLVGVPSAPPALREVRVQPLAWSATRNAFLAHVAAEAP
ncbi:MAG TPA: discoidin domain-containing protein, partial [Gemmatimonadaceae bacterium]|nr:discoidin domain-containing protein [Gemmatimonadaceae bacterium]